MRAGAAGEGTPPPAGCPPRRVRCGAGGESARAAETSAPPLPASPAPRFPSWAQGRPSRARTHLARSRPPARRTWARSPPGGAWCPSTGSARCRRHAPAAPSSWLRSRSSARRGRRGSSAACAPPCRTSRGSAGPAARPRTPARRALAGSASLRGTGTATPEDPPGPFSARPHPQPLPPPTERRHPGDVIPHPQPAWPEECISVLRSRFEACKCLQASVSVDPSGHTGPVRRNSGLLHSRALLPSC